MIIQERILDGAQMPVFPQEGELFLGIETTGLSWRSGFICMAFAVFGRQMLSGAGRRAGKFADGDPADLTGPAGPVGAEDRTGGVGRREGVCRTYVCRSRRDEGALLAAVRELTLSFDRILTFDGNQFTLRFLQERYVLQSDDAFLHEGLKTESILESLRPLRHLIPTGDLKRKNLEAYAGYMRKDPLSGREMVRLYQEWEKEADHSEPGLSLDRMTAHLAEDAVSLSYLARLLALPHLFDASSVTDMSVNLEGDTLHAVLKLGEPVFADLHCESGCGLLDARQGEASLIIMGRRGRLKHFFPGPYKDYYYLPQEDLTIHKSAAMSVDRKHRVRAGARTCFLAREGLFLPLPADGAKASSSGLGTDMKRLLLWKIDYEAKEAFILYEPDTFKEEPDLLKEYVSVLLRDFSGNSTPTAK